jgi:hypothetical protein
MLFLKRLSSSKVEKALLQESTKLHYKISISAYDLIQFSFLIFIIRQKPDMSHGKNNHGKDAKNFIKTIGFGTV